MINDLDRIFYWAFHPYNYNFLFNKDKQTKMNPTQLTLWDYIKSIYMDKYNIPEPVVDMIAVEPILRHCVTGYSISKIVRYTLMQRKYVKATINEYFEFDGWDDDLDFSPLAFYRRSFGSVVRFEEEIKMISSIENDIIAFLFFICKRYEGIVKEIEKYHGQS